MFLFVYYNIKNRNSYIEHVLSHYQTLNSINSIRVVYNNFTMNFVLKIRLQLMYFTNTKHFFLSFAVVYF